MQKVIFLMALLGVTGPIQAQEENLKLLIDEIVLIKDSVRERLARDDKSPGRFLNQRGSVLEVRNGKLRIDRTWLNRDDIMTLDEATRFYAQELKRDPTSAKVWRGKAICTLLSSSEDDKSEKQKIAMSEVREAIRLNPDDAESHCLLARILLAKGDGQNAKKTYQESLRLKPNSPSTLCGLAMARYECQDLTGAIEDCERAIRLDPECTQSLLMLAVIQESAGEWEQAEKNLNQAIDLDRADPVLWMHRANLYLNREDYKRAKLTLDVCIALRPRDAEALKGRASCYMKDQDAEGALADLTRAIESEPNRADLFEMRGAIRFAMKDFEEALKDAKQAINLDPSKEQGQTIIALVYISTERLEDALPHLDAAIAGDGENRQANIILRGSVQHKLGEFTNAIHDYDAAIKLDPTYPAPYLKKAVLLSTCPKKQFRDLAEAERLIKKLVELDPHSAYTHSARATVLALKGDFKSAIALQHEALKDNKYANDIHPLTIIGAADAKARIAAWENGELWTHKPANTAAKAP